MTLPVMRKIESKSSLLSEGEIDQILASIFSGRRKQSFQACRDTYCNHRTSICEPSKEILMTVFTDPVTAEERFAVEVWSGNKKWSRDYSTEEDAQGFLGRECDRLCI